MSCDWVYDKVPFLALGLRKGTSKTQSNIPNKIDYPIISIADYSHGYVLIKCSVEPTGKVSDIQIIKSIDSDCDEQIMDFLACYNKFKLWRPGKCDGQKVAREIVIPFDLSIKGYSMYRGHYNHFWMHDPFWMHNNMMMMPTITPPPMPPMPSYSGFY